MQVAMVLVLIAVHGRPVWVSLLVYATLAVTVLSGADYFFGVFSRSRAGSGGGVEPGAPAGVNH
jgi:CDP-diacylglycerol--glycerol-3-phosphate 3-phosphatidyltransferase